MEQVQPFNLGLENFWNPMKEKYPEAVEAFWNWIDQYKEKVEWTNFIPEAKFHDLPLAMQFGIFMQYCNDLVELERDNQVGLMARFFEEQLAITQTNLTAPKFNVDHLEDLPNWDRLSPTTNEELRERAEQGKVVSIGASEAAHE